MLAMGCLTSAENVRRQWRREKDRWLESRILSPQEVLGTLKGRAGFAAGQLESKRKKQKPRNMKPCIQPSLIVVVSALTFTTRRFLLLHTSNPFYLLVSNPKQTLR